MLLPALLLFEGMPEGAKIPLAMLLVFGTAKLLAELFERFKQPGIVGEILAGVLLGPSVLGWITPNDLLKTLADLGVMFLLFRVGLEVQPAELLKSGAIAAVVATCGVILPLVMGWGILLLWGAGHIEALFVGAAMVATSVGITAQILTLKGVLRERASQIILAAAVIDDVLGLLVLAGVSSMARGRVNILEISVTVLLAVAFVVVVAKWGTKAMKNVVPRVQASLRLAEAEFALAMVFLFSLSLLAVFTGVAAIVGAFLAGMVLAGNVGTRVRDLAHGTTELLVPFFLVGIGLHVQLGVFRDPSMIALALIVVTAAVVSKLFGCGLPALRLGRQDALRIGLGMVPRGEVGMVVAQLGLSIGVISPNIYGVVIFMAIATTLLAPPFMNLVYKNVPNGELEEVFHLG